MALRMPIHHTISSARQKLRICLHPFFDSDVISEDGKIICEAYDGSICHASEESLSISWQFNAPSNNFFQQHLLSTYAQWYMYTVLEFLEKHTPKPECALSGRRSIKNDFAVSSHIYHTSVSLAVSGDQFSARIQSLNHDAHDHKGVTPLMLIISSKYGQIQQSARIAETSHNPKNQSQPGPCTCKSIYTSRYGRCYRYRTNETIKSFIAFTLVQTPLIWLYHKSVNTRREFGCLIISEIRKLWISPSSLISAWSA